MGLVLCGVNLCAVNALCKVGFVRKAEPTRNKACCCGAAFRGMLPRVLQERDKRPPMDVRACVDVQRVVVLCKERAEEALCLVLAGLPNLGAVDPADPGHEDGAVCVSAESHPVAIGDKEDGVPQDAPCRRDGKGCKHQRGKRHWSPGTWNL